MPDDPEQHDQRQHQDQGRDQRADNPDDLGLGDELFALETLGFFKAASSLSIGSDPPLHP